jgi:hypothetical protein
VGKKISQIADWHGEIVTVPRGRLPLPFDTDQDLDTDTTRIRQELGYIEPVTPDEALGRTVDWERANPPEQIASIGMPDYGTEDEILAEIL